MPIKEIVTLGIGVLMALAVTGGPWNLKSNMRKVQVQILREVGRTDNWGKPVVRSVMQQVDGCGFVVERLGNLSVEGRSFVARLGLPGLLDEQVKAA